MEPLNTTSRYEHIRKGGLYKIVAIHKMKCPNVGTWIPCVTYKSLTDGRVWTRSYDSFVEHFRDFTERVDRRNKQYRSDDLRSECDGMF